MEVIIQPIYEKMTQYAAARLSRADYYRWVYDRKCEFARSLNRGPY